MFTHKSRSWYYCCKLPICCQWNKWPSSERSSRDSLLVLTASQSYLVSFFTDKTAHIRTPEGPTTCLNVRSDMNHRWPHRLEKDHPDGLQMSRIMNNLHLLHVFRVPSAHNEPYVTGGPRCSAFERSTVPFTAGTFAPWCDNALTQAASFHAPP